MDISHKNENFSFAGQINLEDLQQLKADGFTTLMCNRPDDEEAGQLSFQAVSDAAQTLGMQVAHVPVIPGKITPEDVTKFKTVLDDATGKIFAYCKTGGRCNMLWDLAQQG